MVRLSVHVPASGFAGEINLDRRHAHIAKFERVTLLSPIGRIHLSVFLTTPVSPEVAEELACVDDENAAVIMNMILAAHCSMVVLN